MVPRPVRSARTPLALGLAVCLAAAAHPTARAQKPAEAVQSQTAATVHVLNRLGYGPRPGDVERVQRIGLEAYIAQQLHPEKLPDEAMAARLAPLDTLGLSTRQLSDDYFEPRLEARRQAQRAAGATNPAAAPQAGTTAEMPARTPIQMEAMRERVVLTNLQQQKILRAAYSERQLEEVMVDFWFNHFNVFAGKGQTRVYLTEYERDAIRPHVFGTFRELLGAVAESPAMLFYLDNWRSSAPIEARAPARNAGARGRMARAPDQVPRPAQNRRPGGLNENYARELMELHTLGVDGGYTQKDVQEVARAFTGWTIANPRQGGGFQFAARMHDDGEKVVLGQRISAGGGRQDGDRVLDILARHPSTARFIATKLARRFVADDPPPALVTRAAERFSATGGNIREVVRLIVTSPEFAAPAAQRAKVKTPFEFIVSAVRATGLETPNAMPIVQAARELGMPLYGCQPPTGYADRADAWVNTGALLGRMNFAVALTSGPMRGGQGARAPAPRRNARVSASAETILQDVLGGGLTDSTRAVVAKATEPSQAVALLLGSPEFQKR